MRSQASNIAKVDFLLGDLDDLGANWLPSGNWLPSSGSLVTGALGLPSPKKLMLYGGIGLAGIILVVVLIKRRG